MSCISKSKSLSASWASSNIGLNHTKPEKLNRHPCMTYTWHALAILSVEAVFPRRTAKGRLHYAGSFKASPLQASIPLLLGPFHALFTQGRALRQGVFAPNLDKPLPTFPKGAPSICLSTYTPSLVKRIRKFRGCRLSTCASGFSHRIRPQR